LFDIFRHNIIIIFDHDPLFLIPAILEHVSIDSRIKVLDLAEKVEKTSEREAQERLRQVTRHGTQPSGTSVPLQRVPTRRHRTSGRRMDRKR